MHTTALSNVYFHCVGAYLSTSMPLRHARFCEFGFVILTQQQQDPHLATCATPLMVSVMPYAAASIASSASSSAPSPTSFTCPGCAWHAAQILQTA